MKNATRMITLDNFLSGMKNSRENSYFWRIP